MKCTVWVCEADGRFYILSGQHLVMAIKRIRDKRHADNLPLFSWHKTVRADVLRFETPIADRRTVSGAENASARVTRQTSITECLANLLEGGPVPEEELNSRIAQAIEDSGLNVDKDNPYRTVRQWAPVAVFVLHFGERALKALREFERRQKAGVTLNTLNKMRAVMDPAFLEDVIAVLASPKSTLAHVSSCVSKCAKVQWYT